MYLQCPLRKGNVMIHTDVCVAEHCKYLTKEVVAVPLLQKEHYHCNLEAVKQRGKKGKEK